MSPSGMRELKTNIVIVFLFLPVYMPSYFLKFLRQLRSDI